MPRIIGLDIGERRIGVAVSDPLNITAQGLKTITVKNTEDAIARIKGLIKEYEAVKIIVGMPFNMNGTKGERALAVENFAALLRKNTQLDIETIDERLTTAQGNRLLLDSDISREKRKGFIDKISAQLILQSYIDSHV